MPLKNLFKKIVALQEFDIEEETIDIINKNSEFLSDLLATQLASGKDANNENVTVFGRDYYSDSTVFNKQRHGYGLGKVTDRITNYMSGSFYHGLGVKTSGTRFIFSSNVPYYSDILSRSGDVIMKLSYDNLLIFRNEILVPELKARWRTRNTQ